MSLTLLRLLFSNQYMPPREPLQAQFHQIDAAAERGAGQEVSP